GAARDGAAAGAPAAAEPCRGAYPSWLPLLDRRRAKTLSLGRVDDFDLVVDPEPLKLLGTRDERQSLPRRGVLHRERPPCRVDGGNLAHVCAGCFVAR